jgi:hypothetical protein
MEEWLRYGQNNRFKWLIRGRALRCIRSWMSCTPNHTLHQHSFAHPFSSLWQILLIPFVFCGIDSPLSTPALQSTARCVTVELSLSYCLFGNAWFNPLSRASYGLTSYLDGLQLKGTLHTIILYLYLYTTVRYRSPVGLVWVTAFQVNILTPHLSSADLLTILRWYLYS